MEGASGTLYEGEKFQLLFKFSSRYPFDSPQVCAFHFSRIKIMYLHIHNQVLTINCYCFILACDKINRLIFRMTSYIEYCYCTF